MQLRNQWWLVGTVLMVLVACGHRDRRIAPGGESEVSALSLGLPDRTQLPPGAQSKLTGFRVVAEPLADNCAAAIDATRKWDVPSTTHSIKQGCDWSIGVELGQLDAAGTKLAAVYYTNRLAPKQGQLLKKEDFFGKATFTLKLTVQLTAAGEAAGLGKVPSGGGTGGSQTTDLVIDVSIGPGTPGPGTPGPTPAGDFDWRKSLQMTDVPEVGYSGDDYGSPHFVDVFAHTNSRFTTATATTNAHETMHGLLNDMNNATSAQDQFVYFEKGKGAYVLEPKMHASKIKDYLPAGAKTLAQSRHDLYLVQQVAAYFPNVLYQFDEWNAYVTNARVALEIKRAGKWDGSMVDEVDGAMDFVYFASAAVQGLKENEPDYLGNAQFKAAYAMLVEESMKYVNEGVQMQEFSGFHAKQLREHFVTSPENAKIRATLQGWLGAGWTKRVLGF